MPGKTGKGKREKRELAHAFDQNNNAMTNVFSSKLRQARGKRPKLASIYKPKESWNQWRSRHLLTSQYVLDGFMVQWGKHVHLLITWPPVLRTNTHHYTHYITLIPAHCGVLLLVSSPPDWVSLFARQRPWWRTKVCTDPHTVTEAWCVSLQALQAQSRVWPQSIRRAPATSALRPRAQQPQTGRTRRLMGGDDTSIPVVWNSSQSWSN